MLLTRDQIREHRRWGSVVIEPFNEGQLNTASYDVTLGKWSARYDDPGRQVVLGREPYAPLYRFVKAGDYPGRGTYEPYGHMLRPGERILAHTREAIGGQCSRKSFGRAKAVNTELRATSTMARIGISICDDAGWGDVGYVNRWTLEITNRSPFRLVLPIGSVVGQIVFHEVAPPSGTHYADGGNYNHEADAWTPQDMLPKAGKVLE